MSGSELGGILRRNIRSIAGASVRTALLSTLVLTLSPLMATSLSMGDRPSFVEEAKAALVADALLAEAREVWENRPRGQIAERGSRVFDPNAAAAVRAFAAGQLGQRASLLTAGLAGGDEMMRTALAAPHDTSANMSLSASLRRSDLRLSRPGEVQMASLAPTPAPGATASDAGGSELAYAPSAAPSVSSRFDDILRDRDPGFVPPLGEKDHAWAATPLPAAAFSQKEQTCLATGIYFEARGEEARGQEAVAQVILNRVRAPSYPDTICDVVYQNQHMRNRCQFSFACDGIPDRITNKRAYAKAERIALAVTKGEIWLPEVGSATHYHATYVRPRWARAMERVEKIGLHVFYRTFGGGWN